MKESRLVPLLALLLLFGVLVYSQLPKKSAADAPAPPPADNAQAQTNWSTGNAAAATAEITNPPAAATTKPATPATPEIAPTAPAEKSAPAKIASRNKVVEMPAAPPTAPKNFYPPEFSTNHTGLFDSRSDFYFAARAGYEHSGYGNNRDTWYAAIKFYAHPEKLRARAGNNAWLVPDAEAEFSHQALPRPENSTQPGPGDGVQLRADFYWNWINWTTREFARENCACAYARPMTFTFGPLLETGFQKTFEGSAFRSDRYAGARLAIDRYAFVQYAFGKTDGFSRVRERLLGELPITISHDERVRYVLRGEWERGDRSFPSFYEAGVFVEMPLGLLARPREWHDLIPFAD